MVGRRKATNEVGDLDVDLPVGPGVTPVEAKYWSTGVAAYDLMPQIQCLGPIRSRESLAKKIRVRNGYRPELRDASTEIRLAEVGMLPRFFFPTEAQVDAGVDFLEALRNGYLHRPLKTKASVKEVQAAYENQSDSEEDDEPVRDTMPVVASTTWVGVSGMGKTRTISRILDSLPQVIWHVNHRFHQVVWIRVQTPQNGSEKAFVLAVHRALDVALGENEAAKIKRLNYSQPEALDMLNERFAKIHLGIVVVDELQHAKKKSKDANDNLLSFLVNFVNSVGVPVYLMGTLACLDILADSFRMARRSIGDILMNFQPGKEFELHLASIFFIQYTKKITKLTTGLIKKFYERTQGVLDLMVLLYKFAQKRAIESGDEVIDEKLLDTVANEKFKVIQPALNALAKKNITMLKKYEDLYFKEIKLLKAA